MLTVLERYPGGYEFVEIEIFGETLRSARPERSGPIRAPVVGGLSGTAPAAVAFPAESDALVRLYWTQTGGGRHHLLWEQWAEAGSEPLTLRVRLTQEDFGRDAARRDTLLILVRAWLVATRLECGATLEFTDLHLNCEDPETWHQGRQLVDSYHIAFDTAVATAGRPRRRQRAAAEPGRVASASL